MQVYSSRSSLFCQYLKPSTNAMFLWVTTSSPFHWRCLVDFSELRFTNGYVHWSFCLSFCSMICWDNVSSLPTTSGKPSACKSYLVLLLRGMLRWNFPLIPLQIIIIILGPVCSLASRAVEDWCITYSVQSTCCTAYVHVFALNLEVPNPDNGILTPLYKVTYIWSLSSAFVHFIAPLNTHQQIQYPKINNFTCQSA